jgi:thiol-disulfide isomerase/thioredoxin
MVYFWLHKPTYPVVALSYTGKLIFGMMRTTLLTMLLIAGIVSQAIAREGYNIRLNLPGLRDSAVYLVHYYGKPMPSIYKRDSARLDKHGNATFSSNDPTFVGGIYMVLLADRITHFEFLLNKGDDFTITAALEKLPERGYAVKKITFKNSPENVRFQEYVNFSSAYGERQQQIKKDYAAAKNATDSAEIRKKAAAESKQLITYRRDYAKKYTGTLLANIFNALETPQVPEGDHFLPDGKTKDSSFAYTYYKAHFWDGFDLQDDRLIHTPLYEAKISEYINKLVLPWPDSMEKEADMLLAKTRGTKDLFKYTLWWLTKNVESSKVMGMDEVFVYLVENYYMKGDAFWLSREDLDKYVDRAMKIAPNVIGNIAPEVKTPNVMVKKDESLSALKAKYTLLVFYSPSCGHCQHELPALDSMYKQTLKNKGMKVYTVATEGTADSIKSFITRNKLEEWTNTWDNEHLGDWRSKYDVYSTPSIYLLDDRKIIRGKRLDHSNIAGLIDMLEKQEKVNKP